MDESDHPALSPGRLIDALDAAVLVTDTAGVIVLWNTASEKLYGYSSAEAVDHRLGELVMSPADPVEPADPDDIRGYPGEFLAHDKAGRAFPCRISETPVLDDHGAVLGSVGISRDLTWGADDSESAQLFRRVFDESPIGKAIVGPDLLVWQVNRAFATMLGYEPQELIGHDPSEVTHPDDVQLDVDAVAPLLRGEASSYSLEKRYIAHDRSVIDAKLTGTVIFGPSGNFMYGLAAVEDITEAKAARLRLAEQEQRLALAFEAAGVTAWDADIRTGRLMVSDVYERFYAQPPPRTLDELARLVLADDRDVVADMQRDVAGPLTGEVRFVDGRGSMRHVEVHGTRVRDDDGRLVTLRGMLLDVTKQREARERELRSELVYSAVIETSVDGFVGVDAEGRITDWNGAAAAMFGWSRAEVLGRSLVSVLIPAHRRAEHLSAMKQLRNRGAETGPRLRAEVTAMTRAGDEIPVELQVMAITSGGTTTFKSFIRDLTEHKEYERALAVRADTDPLTGLANRAFLFDRLSEALAGLSDSDEVVGVLYIDVDRFKIVNDSLGHSVGDRLLVALADRLRTALRPHETLARFGGDEFVLVCEGWAGASRSAAVADRLHRALVDELVVGEHRMTVDVSIGVAVGRSVADTPDELLRDADEAMYRAKRQPGPRWLVFDEKFRTQSIERLDLERELRRALEKDEFCLHYQPIVDMHERLVGLEALVRWSHPDRGLVMPGAFIPVAEETGLIMGLGDWVIGEACRQLAEWQGVHPGAERLSLAVNLSGRQLVDGQIARRLEALLRRHRLAPSRLSLEITESVLMDETGVAAQSLAQLHRLGVDLAIDDFGTGYSSLLSLRRFPVQVLKLDRRFVAGLGRDPRDTAIVRSGIELAHSLGLAAIAEGVEDEVQLERLRGLGCDYAQGFFWSPALPPGQVESWFETAVQLRAVEL